MHEQTHVVIYDSYGIDSKVDYFSYFPHVATVAEEPCPTEECQLAQNNAEGFAYVLMPLMTIIFIGFLFLIGSLEKINEVLMEELK